MIAYLDSSAIVKLVVIEEESDSLATALGEWRDLATSALSRVEVVRAVGEEGAAAMRRARSVVSALAVLPLTERLLDAAAAGGPLNLRSLDAVHLATALDIGDRLGSFVSYDRRQLAAAGRAGLPTASPV